MSVNYYNHFLVNYARELRLKEKKYSGKFTKVYEEIKNDWIFESTYFNPSVTVLPIREDGYILYIKEFRPDENRAYFKPVTGMIENNLSWKETANLELQEEAGLYSQNLELLLDFNQNGLINVNKKFVLARSLKPSEINNPDGEVVIEKKYFHIQELLEMTMDGRIPLNIDSMGILYLNYKIQMNGISL